MSLPLSQLIYAKFRQTSSERRVITLHRYNEMLNGMRDIGLASNPDGTVIGLQASKGVYLSRTITGYMWFVGPLDKPSPVHFGDSMQEIERFLWDEIDRQPSEEPVLPFLIGAEQGGIMALAMAAAVPDLISGVVAIDATFPIVPGWEPPLAPLEGLPILLVDSGEARESAAEVLVGEELVSTFDRWGGTVATAKPDGIAGWLAQQPVRTRR
jgi:pimeloyl-ACP methyl ester carboxylesterase